MCIGITCIGTYIIWSYEWTSFIYGAAYFISYQTHPLSGVLLLKMTINKFYPLLSYPVSFFLTVTC